MTESDPMVVRFDHDCRNGVSIGQPKSLSYAIKFCIALIPVNHEVGISLRKSFELIRKVLSLSSNHHEEGNNPSNQAHHISKYCKLVSADRHDGSHHTN